MQTQGKANKTMFLLFSSASQHPSEEHCHNPSCAFEVTRGVVGKSGDMGIFFPIPTDLGWVGAIEHLSRSLRWPLCYIRKAGTKRKMLRKKPRAALGTFLLATPCRG